MPSICRIEFSKLGTYNALFVGNYDKTPFGVHLDPESVFHIPVIGRKAMRTWPNACRMKHPGIAGAQDYILNDLEIDRKAGCQVARHTYSTMRRLAGASLLEIGEELGHKKPETMKRYVGSLPLEQRKVNALQLESFKRRENERDVNQI